jgi:Fe-Mn family superoxide dismutase
MLLEQTIGFTPIKLPYELDALEPYIDRETMNLHYNKHYKGYVKKLNANLPKNNTKSLVEIIKTNKKEEIRNNGGGAYNHQLFWQMMSPTRMSPKGDIKQLIEGKYKSMSNFYNIFTEKSLSHFGSGWCWLVLKNYNLDIVLTENQDNPIMFNKGKPILGLDLWEHAYYKKYGPDREMYIKNWYKVINWDFCNQAIIL